MLAYLTFDWETGARGKRYARFLLLRLAIVTDDLRSVACI